MKENKAKEDKLAKENNAKKEKLLKENKIKQEKIAEENEKILERALKESESDFAKAKDQPERETSATAPDCPLLPWKLIFYISLQVCFEAMVPPVQIIQCKNGHFVCEFCK